MPKGLHYVARLVHAQVRTHVKGLLEIVPRPTKIREAVPVLRSSTVPERIEALDGLPRQVKRLLQELTAECGAESQPPHQLLWVQRGHLVQGAVAVPLPLHFMSWAPSGIPDHWRTTRPVWAKQRPHVLEPMELELRRCSARRRSLELRFGRYPTHLRERGKDESWSFC